MYNDMALKTISLVSICSYIEREHMNAVQVVLQEHDANLGRMVTRVVLPRVIMHSRQHYGVRPLVKKLHKLVI